MLLPITFWLLKRWTRTLNFQSNKPPQKLTRPSLSWKSCMSLGCDLHPIPSGSWGQCLSQRFIYMIFGLFQKLLSKIWSDTFWGKRVRKGGGGVTALRSLLTCKKGARTLDFPSNVSPSEIHTTSPSTKTLYDTVHNIEHFPPDPEGLCWPKKFYHLIFELFWTKWLSQTIDRIDLGGKKVRRRESHCTLRSPLTLESGTKTFNFQSNKSFWSFSDQPFNKSLIWLGA